MRRLALLLVLSLLLAPRPASAQELLLAGHMTASSGVESAGRGILRARTRVRVGAELRVDESPKDGIAFSGIVDLEPRAAVGGDIRYVRLLTSKLAFHAGAIGYAAPGTLLGAVAGLEVRVPLTKSVSFVAAPEVTVFFLGTDLPDVSIFWQGLVGGGIRVEL